MLDSEVFYHKCKHDISTRVSPQSWSMFDQIVAMWCDIFYESFEGNNFSLFYTIHSFAYFDMDKTVMLYFRDIVLLLYFIGEKSDYYFHILVCIHWLIKVLVINGTSVIYGAFMGIVYDTVNECFGIY